MAELVEQRAHIVGGQQRRLARRALGEVVVVDDDRKGIAIDARLVAIGAHPRAAALGRTREVVGKEDADDGIVRTAHFEGADIRVIDGKIGTFDKVDAEQPVRGVERGAQHAVEREVRLEHRAIEAELRGAHLFGIVAPVPGLDRMRLAFGKRHRPQRRAFGRGARLCRLPHLGQQLRDGCRGARHAVDQRVVRIVAIAMQSRQFVAQREDLPRDRTIVVLAIVLATAGPRLERLLAQVASLREREKRHDQRTRQRDHGAGAVAPLLRGRACRGAHVLGQAGHVALVLQRQPVVRFVGQDVLAEARRQRGKTLDNGRAAGPGFLGKPRAGTFEIKMYALATAAVVPRRGPVRRGGGTGRRCARTALRRGRWRCNGRQDAATSRVPLPATPATSPMRSG